MQSNECFEVCSDTLCCVHVFPVSLQTEQPMYFCFVCREPLKQQKHLRLPKLFQASASRYKEHFLLPSNHYEPYKSEQYLKFKIVEKIPKFQVLNCSKTLNQMVTRYGIIFRCSHLNWHEFNTQSELWTIVCVDFIKYRLVFIYPVAD